MIMRGRRNLSWRTLHARLLYFILSAEWKTHVSSFGMRIRSSRVEDEIYSIAELDDDIYNITELEYEI